MNCNPFRHKARSNEWRSHLVKCRVAILAKIVTTEAHVAHVGRNLEMFATFAMPRSSSSFLKNERVRRLPVEAARGLK